MGKIKKAIIKWLLGEDWKDYWELHDKYREEISRHCSKTAILTS